MWDLTHPIESGMQTFPGDPPVAVTSAATVDEDGYAVRTVELGSHTGTHVDAPAHVVADGRTLDEYEPSAFVFDAAVVDCRDLGARAAIPPDRVPTDDALDCVVFHTGWDDHWGTDAYRDHPSVSPAAAEVCVERGLAVATDTLNPDPTPSPAAGPDEPDGVPVHETVLGAGLLVIENLTGLESVPDRFRLSAQPLALGGDGAPVRAVGRVP
ncbi:cyclase family protein [Halobaculum sp. MBLA0147]|uniref:cyclase family protein n=1 Tax=Halobaculum sp. MBLA0147 TaxID=3079934 RepID=UPI003524F240